MGELYEFAARNEIDREFIPRPITIRPMGSLHCEFTGYALQLPRYRCRMTRAASRYRLSITSPPAVQNEENPSSWLNVTNGDKLWQDFEFHTRNQGSMYTYHISRCMPISIDLSITFEYMPHVPMIFIQIFVTVFCRDRAKYINCGRDSRHFRTKSSCSVRQLCNYNKYICAVNVKVDFTDTKLYIVIWFFYDFRFNLLRQTCCILLKRCT